MSEEQDQESKEMSFSLTDATNASSVESLTESISTSFSIAQVPNSTLPIGESEISRKNSFNGTMESWIHLMKFLLEIERKEDANQAADFDTRNLKNKVVKKKPVVNLLKLSETYTGFGGRVVHEVIHAYQKIIPSHKITTGDIVSITPLSKVSSGIQNQARINGVVAKVEDEKIVVACEDADVYENCDFLDSTLQMRVISNDATYRMMNNVLDTLPKYNGEAKRIIDVFFNGKMPQCNDKIQIQPINSNLNTSQIEAIEYALSSEDITLIHGPPGTGKSTTLIEFILQAVLRNERLLVCAGSNVAVDTLVEKLAQVSGEFNKLSFVRLGHPARLSPTIVEHSLDLKVSKSEEFKIIEDVHKEARQVLEELKHNKDKILKKILRKRIKILQQEIQRREVVLIKQILKNCNVVLATTIGAGSKCIKDDIFDTVIIDEAAQVLEVSCWIPILKGKRCVLAGDHCQLPPTIKSLKAKEKGLDKTMFDRALELHGSSFMKMLTTQYRMNQIICSWASKAMYQGKLIACPSVATRRIADLVYVKDEEDTVNSTMLLLDTSGCNFQENRDSSSESRFNLGEVQVVVGHVKRLLELGLSQRDVAIVTPYSAQVSKIKAELHQDYPKLEIRSVDGFQGCEKEAVILSFVRCNGKRDIGFLYEDRRLNVAITRARRSCTVICDSDTVRAHPFINDLLTYIEEYGEVRSAEEYLLQDVIHSSFDEMTLGTSIQYEEPKLHHEKESLQVMNPVLSTKDKVKGTKTPVLCEKLEKKNELIKEDRETIHDSIDDNESKVDCMIHWSTEMVKNESLMEKVDYDENSIENVMEEEQEREEEEQEREEEDDKKNIKNVKEDNNSMRMKNDLLKQLNAERMERKQKNLEEKKAKKKKENQPKVKKNEEQERKIDWKSMEVDECLDLGVKLSKTCWYGPKKCKKSVQVMGVVCKFCKQKYCFEHIQAEVHGCGNDTRKEAQSSFKSAIPKKSVNRGALSDALSKKLNTAKGKRTSKTSKKK